MVRGQEEGPLPRTPASHLTSLDPPPWGSPRPLPPTPASHFASRDPSLGSPICAQPSSLEDARVKKYLGMGYTRTEASLGLAYTQHANVRETEVGQASAGGIQGRGMRGSVGDG